MSARADQNGQKNMRLKVAVVSGLLAAVAGIAAAADTGLTPGDRDFINKAAQGGMTEVAVGKLAAQRALSPTVKAFGEKMVTDHTAANDALKSLADSKQFMLPDTVSPEEQATIGKLEGLNGTEFDKTFAKIMVKDHVEDISQFEKQVKKGKDPDVKAYAEQTLPTLRHHLMLANRLSDGAQKSSSQLSTPSAETSAPGKQQ
jgi:putative membrane protein